MLWTWLACSAGDGLVGDDSGDAFTPPSWLALPQVESSGDHGEGDVVTGIIGEAVAATVRFDRQGQPTWAFDNGDDNVPSWTKFSPDGSLVHNHHYRDREAARGGVMVTGPDGLSVTTEAPQHHHAALLLDGFVYYIRVSFVEMNIDGAPVVVATDELVRKPLGGKDEVVLFSFEDDYAVRPFPHCAHWDDSVYYKEAKDWTHANSLAYDEDQDAILIVARYLDVVLSIDRATGDLNWELGGQDSEWELAEGGDGFNHPHLSSFRDDQLVMFDNGDHKVPPVSRVVVYELDRDARVYTQVREVLEPTGSLNALLGDANVLDSGNLLVSWSESGLIQEIDPDDQVVWSLQMPLGTITGRVDTR